MHPGYYGFDIVWLRSNIVRLYEYCTAHVFRCKIQFAQHLFANWLTTTAGPTWAMRKTVSNCYRNQRNIFVYTQLRIGWGHFVCATVCMSEDNTNTLKHTHTYSSMSICATAVYTKNSQSDNGTLYMVHYPRPCRWMALLMPIWTRTILVQARPSRIPFRVHDISIII